MNNPRTLPIRVHPIPGEALDSWLTLLAHRLHTPLANLLPELGLAHQKNGHTNDSGDIPTAWTVLLRPYELDMIASATGVDPSTINAMTLRRYDGVALRIDHTTRQVERKRLWGRNAGSRYCPDCLTETSGRWLLSWRLGWSFACTTHRRLLADVCPGCGRVPLPRRRLLADLSEPGRCAQPSGPHARGRFTARCGHDLAAAITPQFPQDHPVLHAQHLIHEVIDEGKARFGIYAAEPLPANTVLSDLRALAGRTLSYVNQADLITLPHDLLAAYNQALTQPGGYHRPAHTTTRPGYMAPAHAAITALGATAAVGILNTDSIRDAGTALRWLIETARHHGVVVNPSALRSWGQETSAILRSIQLSALAPFLKPSDQLRYRAGAAKPPHQVPSTKAASRLHRVPSMIWTTWALRLRPGKAFFLRTLQPALSAALLLPGTRHSLPAAAEILGAVAHPRELSRLLGALQANPHWPDILAALTRLTDFLDDNAIPIDYHRRRHLDYRVLLSCDQWRRICRRTGFPPGRQSRLDLARCLLFKKISTAPADQAPASFAVATPYARDRLLHFTAEVTPDLAAHLNEVALEFLAQNDIHDEPVEWQPPAALLDGLLLPGDDPDRVDLSTLHHLVRSGNQGSFTTVAQKLDTTLDGIRHLLERHPAPPRRLTDSQSRATGQLRPTARSVLSEQLLTYLYNDQQLTLREIGRRFGFSQSHIGRLLDEYDITRHEPRRPSGIVINRDWLYDQYVNHRRTLPDLAHEVGMSTSNMARWARTHNIPVRSRGGGSHNQVRVTLDQATTALCILRPAITGHGAWSRLHRFAAAAEHRTVGAAATALGLTASTLVTQINRLERDLGGQLLTRAERGQPMLLTPLGKKVITAVRKHSSEEMPRS